MAHKNTRSGLIVALFVVSVWLALASAKSYQKFLREHVDYPVTQIPDIQHYCNLMMKRRSMAKPNYCKRLNTFLHVDTPQIQAVCDQAGEPTTGDLRESEASFPMTVCRLRKGCWAPDCQYEGTHGIERVVIACEDDLPVHLETEVPDY